MLLDKEALFSDDQAITASAASTNYMDLGATGTPANAPAAVVRDLGGGQNVTMLVQVTEDFATLTSLTVDVEVDDNTSFSSAKTVATTGAVAVANLTAGKILSVSVPLPVGTDERYLRLNYTVAGVNATAGKITAGVAAGVQTNG
jgi:hypothetical protein